MTSIGLPAPWATPSGLSWLAGGASLQGCAAAGSPPGGPSATAYLWRTRLTVLHDEDVDLGREVARAAAWQTGGEVAERHS